MADRLIDKLLRRLVPAADAHLSDEIIASLFCRELSPLKSLAARRHLGRCGYCRLRQQHLEGPRADRMLRLYSKAASAEDAPPPDGLRDRPREAFAQWLEERTRLAAPPRRRFPRLTLPSLPGPHARMAALGFAVALTAILGLSLWRSQMAPAIGANALLARAEQSDAASGAADPGVARQTIRIKAQGQTMERSLYWDMQGKRQPRKVGAQGGEAQFRSTLARAGIDWDQPISAAGYQAWRDRQGRRADRVTVPGAHLLTLTTIVPEGDVSQESLTVRDTDFHPLRRIVNFRDHETVEVAELDFKILPWSAVDASLFDPAIESAGGLAPTLATAAASPVPRFPVAPSPDQLDETELAARLILNHLRADTGEQIEIHRSPQGIEVAGLVDTEERKRQLRTELMTVSRLKVSIQSAAEANRLAAPAGQTISVQEASLPDNPSPLEAYLRARGRSVEQINRAAQEIFNGALAISHESQAIADLETRFVPAAPRPAAMPLMESATVADLLYSHQDRLREALRRQRLLLAEVEGAQTSKEAGASSAGLTLTGAAARNLALARELTQTNAASAGSAEAILAAMSATADMLADAARQTYGKQQPNSAQGGRN